MGTKSKKSGMPRPIDIIDELAVKSLSLGQSKEDWLEVLKEFRDELYIQIENVEDEIERDNEK